MVEASRLQKIVEDLKSPRPFIRGKAVDSLMLVRDEAAIPLLFKLTQKEMDFIKVQLCRLLGKIRSPQGVGPLVAFLMGPSERVANEAALALDRIDHDRKTEALMHLLNEKNSFAKVYAIKALGAEKRIKAVPLLITMLESDEPGVRELVIDALRQIADPAAVLPLTRLLGTPDQTILYLTIYALGEIGDKLTAAKLATFLSYEKPDIRRAAVWAVSKLNYSRAIPRLIEMLKNDTDDEVREEVCKRLAGFNGKHVAKPLLYARTFDKSHNVRVYADWALRDIPLSDKRDLFLRHKDDPDETLRGVVLLELGETGEREFLKILKGALKKDASEFARACAAEGLAFFESAEVLADLTEALKDKEEVRRRAMESLSKIKERSGIKERLGPR